MDTINVASPASSQNLSSFLRSKEEENRYLRGLVETLTAQQGQISEPNDELSEPKKKLRDSHALIRSLSGSKKAKKAKKRARRLLSRRRLGQNVRNFFNFSQLLAAPQVYPAASQKPPASQQTPAVPQQIPAVSQQTPSVPQQQSSDEGKFALVVKKRSKTRQSPKANPTTNAFFPLRMRPKPSPQLLLPAINANSHPRHREVT